MAVSRHRKRKCRTGISPEVRARAEAKFKIMECLDDSGEVSGQHILDKTGLSKVEAVSAMKALVRSGHVVQVNLFYFRKAKGQPNAVI